MTNADDKHMANENYMLFKIDLKYQTFDIL